MKIAIPEVALQHSTKDQFILFHLSNPRAKQACFIYNYVCPSVTKEKHELELKFGVYAFHYLTLVRIAL